MKIYACENCSYRSKRLADLQRHKNKKSPCINEIKVNVDKEKVPENNTPLPENTTHFSENTTSFLKNPTPFPENTTPIIVTDAKCSKCFKVFSRVDNMRVHEKKCDGTHRLQCKICFKMFASLSGKYKHKKNVKCSPPAITSAASKNISTKNMSNINISMDKPTIYTNNNNITNNNYNLIKADFGKECLQKLCNSEKYTQNMIENLDLGRYAIPKTIEQIYFNDDFPENQTLKKERRTDKLVSIQRKGKWETRFFEDICQDLIKKTEAYHQKYFEDLKIKYKDTPKDKKFKEILMPIIIFARMMKKHGINLDLKELGIHLDDEELEEEDYKQILCFRKDMEILMLDEIHEQTVKQPEAIEED